MLRFLVFTLAWIGWLPSFALGSFQAQIETHPVQVIARSAVAKGAAEVVCIRAPKKGLSEEQWRRSVHEATQLRTEVPMGEASEVRLPAGEWWVWAEHAQCSTSSKRIIVVPRSKPDHAVDFWLDDHVGVSGRVVDERGRGLGIVTVTLQRWDSVRNISVGVNGSFADDGVKPGTYSVSVTSNVNGISRWSVGNMELQSKLFHVPRGGEAAKWTLVVKEKLEEKRAPRLGFGRMDFFGWQRSPVEGVLVESGQPLERGEAAALWDLLPHFEGRALDLLYLGQDAIKAEELNLFWDWRYASECEWNEDGSFAASVPGPGSYLVRRIRKVAGGGSKGFSVDNHHKRRLVVGPAWLVEVEAGQFEGLAWTVPAGQVHVKLMGEDGRVLQASQAVDEPCLQLLGEELWSEPIRPTPTWNDSVVFEGLPVGRYTLSGVQAVLGSKAGLTELRTAMQSVVILVGDGRVDVNVPMFPSTALKGRVVNPSHSLDGLLHPRLGVYAWKDASRQQLVASTPFDRSYRPDHPNSAGFAFRGLPRKPIYLSVESYPQELGFRGPVIKVDLTDGAPEDFEILVP